jgi:hypothetical protein
MRKQKGFALGELLLVLFYIAVLAGWVMNIGQILRMLDAPVTVLLVLKIIGIFVAPLGVVLGWFG